jgi:DNA-binding NarL/FixJ family response regulator
MATDRSMPQQASHYAHSTPPAFRRSGGLPIHVLLVDDHPAVRQGIRRLISEEPDIVATAETGSASEATSAIARWTDVAVIDYHLRDRDGLWLTQQIKQRPFPPRVLIYSAFADAALAVAAIVAGADGLLSKTALGEELCVAIRRLFRGRQHFPSVPSSLASSLQARLASRDQAIFSMLVHGVPAAELVSRLDITSAELTERRQEILRVIAPKASRARVAGAPHSPLDYDRSRRRHSDPRN